MNQNLREPKNGQKLTKIKKIIEYRLKEELTTFPAEIRRAIFAKHLDLSFLDISTYPGEIGRVIFARHIDLCCRDRSGYLCETCRLILQREGELFSLDISNWRS